MPLPIDPDVGQEKQISEALYRIGLSFSREHDLDRLVQLITEEATEVTGATFGSFVLHLHGADGEPRELIASAGPAASESVGTTVLQIRAACLRTDRQDAIVRVADVRRELPCARSGENAAGPEITSYLAVPVVSAAGTLLGGLYFGHPEQGHFTAMHERAIVGIAGQAATAIENARLYEALKASEEDAKRAYERARRADQSKDEFLAMLGHELRNPLAPMVTALELMRLKDGNWDHERTVIERQVHHLRRLVDDLLDISRVTRGKVQLRRERVDLREVVSKAIELATPVLEERRHRFACDTPGRPVFVYGDQVRLAQVLSNLLTNAAKYTEPGGDVRIEVHEIGDCIEVRVSDSGIGIAEEMLDHVFDLFVQGDRTLDRAQGGLDIGLSIVRNLVELHGGSVSVSSPGLGRGSEFVVRLPLAHNETGTCEDAPSPHAPPTDRHATRILIVEDNHDVAELLAEAVTVMGFEPRRAHDGPSALREAPSFLPHVVLLDIGLPVMDGYDLAVRLRAIPRLRHVKIIAVTGYGHEQDRVRSRQAGIDAHMVKPVGLDQLRDMLHATVGWDLVAH